MNSVSNDDDQKWGPGHPIVRSGPELRAVYEMLLRRGQEIEERKAAERAEGPHEGPGFASEDLHGIPEDEAES